MVDDNNILLGRITIDDVVDIIRDQAEHQALGAAGLDEDEDLFSPVPRAARRRAAVARHQPGDGIPRRPGWSGSSKAPSKQIVALAVLMPIVASMGGVAGTQVLALMVRGLALGQVGVGNLRALLAKEVLVGVLNGAGLGHRASASSSGLWFQRMAAGTGDRHARSLINLLNAALAGVLVPLTLKRLNIDPALAGGVVLTTFTDVIGFLTFLGLATLILLR